MPGFCVAAQLRPGVLLANVSLSTSYPILRVVGEGGSRETLTVAGSSSTCDRVGSVNDDLVRDVVVAMMSLGVLMSSRRDEVYRVSQSAIERRHEE